MLIRLLYGLGRCRTRAYIGTDLTVLQHSWPCCFAGEDISKDESSGEEFSGSEANQPAVDKSVEEPAQPIARPEVAHMGMQPKKARRGRIGSEGSQRKSSPGNESMSVAEQESLALEMLSRVR